MRYPLISYGAVVKRCVATIVLCATCVWLPGCKDRAVHFSPVRDSEVALFPDPGCVQIIEGIQDTPAENRDSGRQNLLYVVITCPRFSGVDSSGGRSSLGADMATLDHTWSNGVNLQGGSCHFLGGGS